MEKTDKQFFLTFLGVTGLLVFITVAVLVAANLIGAIGSPDEKSAAQIKMAEQRIQPIGKVNLKSSPVQALAQAPAAIASTAAGDAAGGQGQDTGSRVYASICQACHMAGIAGAPIVGDSTAWEARIAQGIEILYASALKGKNAMPPKGGNPALSDADVKAAVDHMVKLSNP